MHRRYIYEWNSLLHALSDVRIGSEARREALEEMLAELTGLLEETKNTKKKTEETEYE